MGKKAFLILITFGAITFTFAQFKLGYVNHGVVLPGKLEIYNDNFQSPFEKSTLKIWVGNNVSAADNKYTAKGEIAVFNYSLTPSNYSDTYIYYTYDSHCFELDTNQISKKVEWKKILKQVFPCDPNDPKFLPCAGKILGDIKNAYFDKDAIDVINGLANKLTENKFDAEDKKLISGAYIFCMRLYVEEQFKEVVRVGNLVDLYLLHLTLKQKIGTQIVAQKTPRFQIEGGFYNATYKFQNYTNEPSYSSWSKFPTYTIRLYKYYDFKKTEIHKWPVFYISTGFMHGPLAYRNKPDTLFKGNGFAFNYLDLKGGWYASANYDPKIFFSVFLEAGVQSAFRNDYSINSDSSKIVSFKTTKTF